MVPTMSRPSETEQELRRAAEAGEVLDLSRRGDNVLSAQAIMDALTSADTGPSGVNVRGARIVGRLKLDFITTRAPLALVGCVFEQKISLFHADLPALNLNSSTMPGVNAEGLHIRHFALRRAQCTDSLNLGNARIDGPLYLNDTSVRTTDTAFDGSNLHVSGSLEARRLLVVTNTANGAVWLNGCDVGGTADFTAAVIDNPGGAAMIMDDAQIGRSCDFRRAFIRAGGERNALTLIDATIGELRLDGAVLRSELGCAVAANGMRTKGQVSLREGFDAQSEGPDYATVSMTGATMTDWHLEDSRVVNTGGPAVALDMSAIGSSVRVVDSYVEGTHEYLPTLSISSCDVGVRVVLYGAEIVSHDDPMVLSLFGTKVGRLLMIDIASLTEAEKATIDLNGLTYPEPPEDTDAWLRMLRDRTPFYEARPYQQLAAVHRAAGHEHTARKVLIAQQRDLRRRGDPGNKLWHWFLGVTLGYGYKPSRAVAGLLATFLLALCLVWTAGAHDGLSPAKDRPADSCSPVNRISLAADLAIPLVKLGGSPRCELANGPAGQWATGAGWVVQILGWSFATLSVAGFTGLVRKS
jgi:hypothetical protein